MSLDSANFRRESRIEKQACCSATPGESSPARPAGQPEGFKKEEGCEFQGICHAEPEAFVGKAAWTVAKSYKSLARRRAPVGLSSHNSHCPDWILWAPRKLASQTLPNSSLMCECMRVPHTCRWRCISVPSVRVNANCRCSGVCICICFAAADSHLEAVSLCLRLHPINSVSSQHPRIRPRLRRNGHPASSTFQKGCLP